MQEFTILVVDDDPAILKLLNELLASEPNYRVVLAGDSKEAVRAFSGERRIDVVLTDIHMPDFTGMEMMSDMKKIGFEPEIMVMTANGSPENVEKARKIGARSIILKPFDNLEVIEAEMRKAIEAAAAKRSEEPQDEVTDLTPDTAAAAPTEGLTEQLTKEATEELRDEPTEDLAARLTRELGEELAEGPTVKLKTEESTEEVTELTEDEMTPSVPAPAINLPEHPTAEEISAPRLTRTLAGNRHHVPQETTEAAKTTGQRGRSCGEKALPRFRDRSQPRRPERPPQGSRSAPDARARADPQPKPQGSDADRPEDRQHSARRSGGPLQSRVQLLQPEGHRPRHSVAPQRAGARVPRHLPHDARPRPQKRPPRQALPQARRAQVGQAPLE